jgi:parvulin-like peptidyl-prolyl isomerase
MIMKMRKRAKIVMFVVLISFGGLMVLGWGADITSRGARRTRRNVKENTLAIAGKEEVSASDYSAAYRRLAAQVDAEQWEQLTEAQRQELARAAWEEALSDAIWKQAVERERITLGNEELMEIMRITPPGELLADSSWYVDGQFNYQLYWQMLSDPNTAPQVKQFVEVYKAELAREIVRSKLRSDVTNSLRLTRNQLLQAQHNGGSRLVLEALFVYQLPAIDSTVTREELQAYYDANPEEFEREPMWEILTIKFPVLPSVDDSIFLKERVDDATAALDAGYDFEQIALDFTQDSSQQVNRSLDFMTALEYEVLSTLPEGEVSDAYFHRGGWHLVKMIERKQDSITYQDIHFPLEPSADTRKAVLENIDEFRKRASKENVDSLAVEYNLLARAAYVFETKAVTMPGYPYIEAVKTYAMESKPGDISEPFPEVRNSYYVFTTVEAHEREIVPLDTIVQYVERRVLRERAKNAQRDYAMGIRRKIEAGANFTTLSAMKHVSIDTLRFGSYFEAQTRYGAQMAGACYSLNIGDMTGPVACDIGQAFFICLESEFNPASDMVQTALQNEQTVILNGLADEIFPRKDNVQDYRTARNYYGGD